MNVGTCGWSYYPERGDKLLNYASVFNVVEVNSTFYRLPRLSTAERWLKKSRSVNEDFEFTVKVFQGITHRDKFSSHKSLAYFEEVKKIAKALEAKWLIFQTPKSFKPTDENIKKLSRFFNAIDREDFKIGFEVRWVDEWKKEIVKPLFKELDIVHVVDPLRQNSFYGKPHYYRLHGFGKPMMYNYTFSDEELRRVCTKVKKGDYVMFNNYTMYEDAKRFIGIC